jgi:hypothetical protein
VVDGGCLKKMEADPAVMEGDPAVMEGDALVVDCGEARYGNTILLDLMFPRVLDWVMHLVYSRIEWVVFLW